MSKVIQVLLAHGHPLVCHALRTTCVNEKGFSLLKETADGHDVIHMTLDLQPEVLLLDPLLPGPPAGRIVAYLRQHAPGVPVLILEAGNQGTCVREMIRSGVVGYVLTSEPMGTIVAAIRTVAQGQPFYSQSVLPTVASLARGQVEMMDHLARLSPRETQVLRLLARGYSNRQAGLHFADHGAHSQYAHDQRVPQAWCELAHGGPCLGHTARLGR